MKVQTKSRAEGLLEYVGGILLGLMVVIVFANVVSRYYLNYSLAFTEELSRFMFTWVVLIGTVLALVHNEHLGIDILLHSLPVKARQVLCVINDLIILAGAAILLVGGYRLTKENFNWPAPATNIPYGAVQVIVPVTALLMIFIVGHRVFCDIGAFGKEKRG
ncbi:MAG TPA: TRAP transporter small permease [Firmicutes bacterium]|nr:TRAP transporter small permease [Bacillota bacterium]